MTSNTLTQNYTLHPLSPAQLLTIYTEAAPLHFPAAELRPVSNLKDLLEKGGYEGLGLFDKESNELAGYALFLKAPDSDTLLLDYYAFFEEYRNHGLGSFFLQEMKRHYKNYAGILIETEDPACAANEEELLLRNRRNAFYYKNGAHQTGVSCTLFGVPFRILFLPLQESNAASCPDGNDNLAKLRAAAIQQKLDSLYRFMLPADRYAQGVVWR